MSLKFSTAEENYIKAIYHLQLTDESVTTNEIANALQTKAASVTEMLKKLKDKKILSYEKYQGVKLTNAGNKLALQIVRKHRLWEFFLVEKLHFGWEEVHDIAEELEHITSIKLINELDKFLGFPKFDPHGDPIPDATGKLPIQSQINLTELPLYKKAIITAVGNQNKELLDILKHKKISINTTVEVTKKFAFDNSLELKISNKTSCNLSNQLAEVLFVKLV